MAVTRCEPSAGGTAPAETRATHARARGPVVPGATPAAETTATALRVVSLEIPETDRRTPFVVVHVAVGPLTLALGVVLLRSGWLAVRPPVSVLGKPAVATEPPELWEEIEALAIAAARDDPAARRHLEGHRSRRFAAAASSGPPSRPSAPEPEGASL